MQERVEAEGFGPWLMRADVLHAQPTAEVLEHMVSVRLHLDNCGEENGALALLMRPLLLHASSPSRVPGHRRVVHLDFASVQLPNGMRWFSESA